MEVQDTRKLRLTSAIIVDGEPCKVTTQIDFPTFIGSKIDRYYQAAKSMHDKIRNIDQVTMVFSKPGETVDTETGEIKKKVAGDY